MKVYDKRLPRDIQTPWTVVDETDKYYIGQREIYSLLNALPKANYEPVPEVWVDVTAECRWVDPQSGIRGGISHVEPLDTVCAVYDGYRLRKVTFAGPGNLPSWAFIVEKRS